MTPVEILKAARAKIAKPRRWCKADYAVNADGRPVLPASRHARRWCSIGAIRSVVGPQSTDNYGPEDILDQAAPVADSRYHRAQTLNDTTDHTTVMKMFDHAIKLAEASNA